MNGMNLFWSLKTEYENRNVKESSIEDYERSMDRSSSRANERKSAGNRGIRIRNESIFGVRIRS